ncbi:helicase HerA-like domain-containing protein [Pseudomonadota bacterium]
MAGRLLRPVWNKRPPHQNHHFRNRTVTAFVAAIQRRLLVLDDQGAEHFFGEALISTLQVKGVPGVVDRTLIRPPTSRIGSISEQERSEIRTRSPVGNRYDEAVTVLFLKWWF